MYDRKPHTYEEYKEYLAGLLQRTVIHEQEIVETQPPRSTDEILSQCI